MKAAYEDIDSKKGDASFLAYELNVPYFPFKWHYHPEYELTLIVKGSGKRMVGDSHMNFEAGDLVLIGPDMPHTWVSDDQRKRNRSSAIVIQFSEQFIESLLQPVELAAISRLLTDSADGLFFTQQSTKKIRDQVQALPSKQGVEKITALLIILDQLAAQRKSRLASPYYTGVKGKENEHRLNKVCRYLQKHASEKLSVNNAASLIHLSDSAFCKFFKRATGKTFSDYLNEIRIGLACQQLTESDKPVAGIAYECGFESLTYFNRVFLRKKGVTPRVFRKDYQR